jgi:hypothetical protein
MTERRTTLTVTTCVLVRASYAPPPPPLSLSLSVFIRQQIFEYVIDNSTIVHWWSDARTLDWQVLYAANSNPGVQFNGGTQIYTQGNLILLTSAAWNLGPTPDVMGTIPPFERALCTLTS